MQPLKYFLSLALAFFLFLARNAGAASTNAVPAAVGANSPAVSTNAPPKTETKLSPDDLIQLSFQGANIDMIVQWLAENTGKSVVKHPQAQCQVTIVGSKKVTRREAVTLIYRALALEGFAAIESADSIMIVPEGKEPKISPELASKELERAGSREKMVKVFTLKHTQAALLKDKVKTVLNEKATVEVDDHANALIVTDENDNVAVAGQLIAALDTEHPQDITVRVIALKNANAADLAKELTPLYEKMTGKESKEILQVTASDRANTLMVLSSESNFKTISQLVATLDTEEAQEKVMRSFVLKNADAEDVARQLQDLYKEAESGGSRYPFYVFGGSDNSAKNTKKLSVVSDRRRNAIIVQAAPAQMEGVAQMVEALDEPLKDDSLAPKIFVLKYVSAADIEDVLNELFLKKTQQRNYWFYDEQPDPVADHDVGRLYGKVRITSEPYSNAIIVTSNSGENLAAVEEVLRELDVPSQAGETTFRVGLRFADAPVMANNVNILFAKGGAPPLRSSATPNQNQNNQQQQQQQPGGQQPQSASESNFEVTEQTKEEGYYPWLGGQPDITRSSDTRAQRPVSDLIGRVRVVPDQRSNSLLISANVHFFPQILKLIEEMDVPTAEVMIEARIVEVSSDFLDQLGVRWSPDGTATFTANDYDNSVVISANGQYQKGFGGKTSANNPGPNNNTTTPSVTSALATLRSGAVNNTISVDFLIQFLREHTDATVLAEPQIQIRDNELGKLFVGQQVPFISGSLTTDVGGLNQSFQYKDVGVILEVEPHINEAGDVALRIRTESSTIVPGQTLFGGAIIDTRNFRTELTAKSGQTLILGGIIQKQITATSRKTPVLGAIPGFRWLFNKKDNDTQRVELLIFLRPKVTRTPLEAKALLDDVNKRMPLIQNWEQTEGNSREYESRPLPTKPQTPN
jgi:type II secretion system protein D